MGKPALSGHPTDSVFLDLTSSIEEIGVMDITDFIFSQREEVSLVGDYNGYHAHATRKLHKLRKKLGQTTPKGRKYTAKAPVKAEDIGGNVAYVHLLLVSAERSWAQAMHMKSSHSADPSAKGISGAARRHIISRFNKATGYAKELVALLQDRSTSGATDIDIVEARAYLASLSGATFLEKRNWEQSLQSFAICKVIYTALGQKAKKDAFRDLLTSIVDPSLRYAAYQMKLPRTKPLPSLAITYFPSDSEIRSEIERVDSSCLEVETAGTRRTADGEVQQLPENITWRSRTVPLEDASISQALAAAAAAEARLTSWLAESAESVSSKDKAAAYDNVIIASQDAVDATKTAIDDLTSEGVDSGDKRMQALQITRTAVNYSSVGWRVGRNRVLCGEQDGISFEAGQTKGQKGDKASSKRDEGNGKKLTQLRERMVLYDSTLQSIDFIFELPGVAADSGLVRELEGQRNYFRALRCLAIGRSHGLLGKFTEALALLSQAWEYAKTSASSVESSADAQGPPKLDVTGGQVQVLGTTLRGLVAQYRGLVTLEKISEETSKSAIQRPAVERLHEYPGDGVDLSNLVPYPPQLQAIPVKPLFLDVAWNYIEYPRAGTSTASGVQEEATEQKSSRRGWFGFGR